MLRRAFLRCLKIISRMLFNFLKYLLVPFTSSYLVMNLEKYEEELAESLDPEFYEELMDTLNGDCEGCGGCCMNYNPFTCTMSNSNRRPCTYLSREKKGPLDAWKCDNYEERPEVCRDHEEKEDLTCNPFYKYFEADPVETVKIFYSRSDMGIRDRIKKLDENIELN